MKSVTNNTFDEISRYKTSLYSDDLKFVFAFPIIAVDGEIYEAKFNEHNQNIDIFETDYVRCHWRGADNWQFHATVDIIRLSSLESYLERRRPEIDILLNEAKKLSLSLLNDRY